MTEASPAEEGPESADAQTPALAPDEDGRYDLKAKFREALARKRGMQAEAADLAANTGGSKVGGGRGPAANQRSFRRKSGS